MACTRSASSLQLTLENDKVKQSIAGAMKALTQEQVADAIKFFEKDIRSAGISEAQATQAKYILCATADDIVQNIPTEDRHVWTQYSMLSRFFGERIGGVRFFEELDRAKLADAIAEMEAKLAEKEGSELDLALWRLDQYKNVQQQVSSTAMH